MLIPRIIPCLLLRKEGLVKTKKFRNPKYIGDPINALKIFNNKGVDEIIFLDIDATVQRSKPDYEFIKDVVSECFVPFSYGGGVSSIDSIRTLLQIGIEKVIINTQAIYNPSFVEQAVKEYGSSTVIGAFDIKKNIWGKDLVFDHSKNKSTNTDPLEYCLRLQSLGVGEVFVNNVDREGTYKGLDSFNISKMTKELEIPLIACGGAKDIQDMVDIIKISGASAAAAGNLFVFQKPHNAVLISYPEREQLEKLFL